MPNGGGNVMPSLPSVNLTKVPGTGTDGNTKAYRWGRSRGHPSKCVKPDWLESSFSFREVRTEWPHHKGLCIGPPKFYPEGNTKLAQDFEEEKGIIRTAQCRDLATLGQLNCEITASKVDFSGAGGRITRWLQHLSSDTWGPGLRKQVFYENPMKWTSEISGKQNPQGDKGKRHIFNMPGMWPTKFSH